MAEKRKRSTETEREAVQSLTGRIVKQQREWGTALPDTTSAHKRAVKLATKSDRDRSQKKAKTKPSKIVTSHRSSDAIVSRVATDAYRNNWDLIFGAKN